MAKSAPTNNSYPALTSVVCKKHVHNIVVIQGKSVWNKEKKRADRINCVQIGSIEFNDPNQEINFNLKFLAQNPDFINYHVFRVGKGTYEYKKRSIENIKVLIALVAEYKNKEASGEISADAYRPKTHIKKADKKALNAHNEPGSEIKAKDVTTFKSLVASSTRDVKFADNFVLDYIINNQANFKALRKLLPYDKYLLLVMIVKTILSHGYGSLAYDTESFIYEHSYYEPSFPCDRNAIYRLYTYLFENNIPLALAEQRQKEIFNKRYSFAKDEVMFLALDSTNVDIAGKGMSIDEYGNSKSGNNSFDSTKTIMDSKGLYVHIIVSLNIFHEQLKKYHNLLTDLNQAFEEVKDFERKIIKEGDVHCLINAEHREALKKNIIVRNTNDDKEEQDVDYVKTHLYSAYRINYSVLIKEAKITAARVLVSDYIDDIKDADSTYRERNNIEVSYKVQKDFFGANVLNVSTEKSASSISLALGLATEVHNVIMLNYKIFDQKRKLNDESIVRLPHNSVRGALRVLESVRAQIDPTNKELVLSSGISSKYADIIECMTNGVKIGVLQKSFYAKDEGFIKSRF